MPPASSSSWMGGPAQGTWTRTPLAPSPLSGRFRPPAPSAFRDPQGEPCGLPRSAFGRPMPPPWITSSTLGWRRRRDYALDVLADTRRPVHAEHRAQPLVTNTLCARGAAVFHTQCYRVRSADSGVLVRYPDIQPSIHPRLGAPGDLTQIGTQPGDRFQPKLRPVLDCLSPCRHCRSVPGSLRPTRLNAPAYTAVVAIIEHVC
jgi:hypothetical protein